MRTPLCHLHKSLGARFTEFAGWEMPLEYSSIREEVLSVRNSCGVFDISHMGRLLIKGDSAEGLEYLTSRTVSGLKIGRVQYNLFMNEGGGIKDDITLYKLYDGGFLICVNAGNRGKIIQWLMDNGILVEDRSQELIQFALQGPKSSEVLKKYFPVETIKYYHFEVFDGVIVSRTGYTGEDGFEIYTTLDRGLELFRDILKECPPCGLGARDTLRIEAGMPLYGHEISEDISPFEANLDRYVSLDKDFIGKEQLLKRPVEKRLYGLELLQRGVPREGYRIFYKEEHIGYVSSGTFSPHLQRGIALCFVKVEYRKDGLEVELEVRSKRLPARLRSYPFL
ncbi:MAG: glycine cleavage system aminomethyltransferase GcvT [Aquificaceae bacterium]|nr:glycine cleavage system aminomethyltransferase GcvT [Aquificaceae bacterium]MDW8423708.1 glycine cleavage system aminomethyltransferase GcvT [Aquificaceae bacterium]